MPITVIKSWEQFWPIFHELWGRDYYAENYDKQKWTAMQRWIEELERKGQNDGRT